MLKSRHALNTKVGRNIVMTALTKIQHFCIRIMRVTKISVKVSWLPRQLGKSLQLKPSGIRKWKFVAELDTNFEGHGIIHLPTRIERSLQ
jgi:hypothetical protein